MRMMLRLCRLALRRLGATLRLRPGQERGRRWRRFGIRSGGPGRGGISWKEMAKDGGGEAGAGQGSAERERERGGGEATTIGQYSGGGRGFVDRLSSGGFML